LEEASFFPRLDSPSPFPFSDLLIISLVGAQSLWLYVVIITLGIMVATIVIMGAMQLSRWHKKSEKIKKREARSYSTSNDRYEQIPVITHTEI
jgi:hypothetical protein